MIVRVLPVRAPADIPAEWRGTPIARLLEYHNQGRELDPCDKPALLIGMCMDYRLHLRIPRDFAFIIRTAAANMRPVQFHVSTAIAIGGVRAIALIGHDDCAMIGVTRRREEFIGGLTSAGCRRAEAEGQFDAHAHAAEITSPAEFVAREAERLRETYAGIPVAPLHYSLQDGQLHRVLG